MDDNHCISKQHFHFTFYTFTIMLFSHIRCGVASYIRNPS